MRQVIKHREIKLLKMIRRTDPVIPRAMWMNLRRVVIFQLSAFQRSIFALFGTLREASGWLVMIFTNIFPARVFCCESPQMTMIVTRDFKNATF